MNPYPILVRLGLFAGAAALGVVLTVAVASILGGDSGPQSQARDVPDAVLTADVGAGGAAGVPGEGQLPIAVFDIVPGNPAPAAPFEAGQLLLVAADDPVTAPSANGLPRIPPVSQFDGSTFQGANCNMAAGAMLARLGWGIVTSGGYLRGLQDDQDGGTDLGDLGKALWRGYGVAPSWGAITPAQLRKLVGAGYGAVVHGVYGELGYPYSLQSSFTGPHAIYIDAYFPGNAKTQAAYYVIDPLHKPYSGYRGEWMPADLVERFAFALGQPGRILAAWAFPTGGQAPEIPDIGPLPTGGGVTPNPGEPPPDPAEPPVVLPEEPGDVEPPTPPQINEPPFAEPPLVGGIQVLPRFDFCAIVLRPKGCPTGIIGRYGNTIPIIVGTLFPKVEIRNVDATRANRVMVGFMVTPSGPADVEFWEADGSGPVQRASSFSSLPLGDGTVVRIAHLSTLASTQYHFQVVAAGGFGARSPVGTFTTGRGVKLFDVVAERIDRPVFELASSFSLYSRLAPGAFARPILPCADASDGQAVLLGGSQYCIPPEDEVAPDSCAVAEVDYEVAGLPGDQVAVRAIPVVAARYPDGTIAEETVVEALGPGGTGTVKVGCLTPGIEYEVTFDVIGDAAGTLLSRRLTVAP